MAIAGEARHSARLPFWLLPAAGTAEWRASPAIGHGASNIAISAYYNRVYAQRNPILPDSLAKNIRNWSSKTGTYYVAEVQVLKGDERQTSPHLLTLLKADGQWYLTIDARGGLLSRLPRAPAAAAAALGHLHLDHIVLASLAGPVADVLGEAGERRRPPRAQKQGCTSGCNERAAAPEPTPHAANSSHHRSCAPV
jgi:hypothetical protein